METTWIHSCAYPHHTVALHYFTAITCFLTLFSSIALSSDGLLVCGESLRESRIEDKLKNQSQPFDTGVVLVRTVHATSVLLSFFFIILFIFLFFLSNWNGGIWVVFYFELSFN